MSRPQATGDVREAFLLAANVAGMIRDEYEARGRDASLPQSQRDRANRDATVARQVKGEILAHAGIQEWPAPKSAVGIAPRPERDATSRDANLNAKPDFPSAQRVAELEAAMLEIAQVFASQGGLLPKSRAARLIIERVMFRAAPPAETTEP